MFSKHWDHYLEGESRKFPHNCPPEISSNFPKALAEEFLSRLKSSPGVKYSQKDMIDLGLEISQDLHQPVLLNHLFGLSWKVKPIDIISAELHKVKAREVFEIRVIVVRHLRSFADAVELNELKDDYHPDYTWKFWLDANLQHVPLELKEGQSICQPSTSYSLTSEIALLSALLSERTATMEFLEGKYRADIQSLRGEHSAEIQSWKLRTTSAEEQQRRLKGTIQKIGSLCSAEEGSEISDTESDEGILTPTGSLCTRSNASTCTLGEPGLQSRSKRRRI
jgi:hypothetical protein